MQNSFFRHAHSSMSIEDMIKNIKTFEEFERIFSNEMLDDDIQLRFYIEKLLIKHNKSAHGVSVEAGLSDGYVGNIQNGKKKNPSRDVLIRICIAAEATVDELQEILKLSGHQPLYVRRKRDVIIWFGVLKRNTIFEIDEVLESHGIETLMSE